MPTTGKYLIIIGIIVVIAGVILWLFGDKLGWLGNKFYPLDRQEIFLTKCSGMLTKFNSRT